MRISLLVLMLCSVAIATQAQSKKDKPLWLNVSYFGESGLHPGLKLGAQYPFRTNEKVKNKRGRKPPKIKTRDFLVGANIGGYNHPNNESLYFLNAEIGYRRTNQKGLKSEVFLGIGGFRSFYNIDTYDSGAPNQTVTGAGRGGLMPSISMGIGYDMSMNSNKPIALHLRPTLFLRSPYNHAFAPSVALEAGVTIRLNDCLCPKF